MTDDTDDYGIGKPVDDDYIDVETCRAEVSTTDEDDDLHREGSSVDRADMSHRFDVGDGSGASSETDELIDENAIIEHDGRASTNTFFYPAEAPERAQRQFGRLIRYQEDMWSGMKNEQRAADRRRWISIFCSELEMTAYQQERVQHVIEGLEMSHMAHYSSQEVILAVITLVANEDGRFIRDERPFKNLLGDVGGDLEELRSARDLVRRKSERL